MKKKQQHNNNNKTKQKLIKLALQFHHEIYGTRASF